MVRWNGTGNYLHPTSPHSLPPASLLSLSLSNFVRLYFYPPPPPALPPHLNHPPLLPHLTPLMSIFSEFSLTDAPPTSQPLFPSLYSLRRRRRHHHHHVVGVAVPLPPFPPIPPNAVWIFSTGGRTIRSLWNPQGRKTISWVGSARPA